MNDNLVQMLIEEKFADNVFRASAIVNGLRLWELKTRDEQLARVRLYRDWRVSEIYGKKTAPCFEEAINGRAVPIVCGHNTSIQVKERNGIFLNKCTWFCQKDFYTKIDKRGNTVQATCEEFEGRYLEQIAEEVKSDAV